MHAKPNRRGSLTDLIDTLSRVMRRPRASPTVGDTLEQFGPRAYGPWLFCVGLIAISPATIAPGATWSLAAIALAHSVQMIARRREPWLPRSILSLPLPVRPMRRFFRLARPTEMRIDVYIKPRFVILAEPPFAMLVGSLCAAAAIVSFPLGLIPFAPLVPGLAICLLGLGLTVRDGVILLAGGLMAVLGLSMLALAALATAAPLGFG